MVALPVSKQIIVTQNNNKVVVVLVGIGSSRITTFLVFRKRNNSHDLGGKVEMELEIFTRDEAKAMPAGRGRDGPQKLDDPKRPVTTLMSALNPLLFFKRIAFGNIGRKLIYAGVTIVIGMFFLSAWLALPGLLLKKWLSA